MRMPCSPNSKQAYSARSECNFDMFGWRELLHADFRGSIPWLLRRPKGAFSARKSRSLVLLVEVCVSWQAGPTAFIHLNHRIGETRGIGRSCIAADANKIYHHIGLDSRMTVVFEMLVKPDRTCNLTHRRHLSGTCKVQRERAKGKLHGSSLSLGRILWDAGSGRAGVAETGIIGVAPSI